MVLRIRRRGIPGVDVEAITLRVVCPLSGRSSVHLSIDEAAVALGPLIRGRGPPFIARTEGTRRVRVTASADQRRDFLRVAGPAPTHVSRFEAANRGKTVSAVCGQGNLGLNPSVLARTKDAIHGVRGVFTGALLVSADGEARASSLDETPESGFVLTGPLLVREGRAVELEASAFADPRHLLRFGWVEVKTGVRVDFGLDAMLQDRELFVAAARGEAISLPLTTRLPQSDDDDAPLQEVPVSTERLRDALTLKGYIEESGLSSRGTYMIHGETIQLRFLQGIYPHHVLARLENGRAASILISGSSNRSGVVIEELASDLARSGIREALLLDNGGDVGLYLPQQRRFDLTPSESDRALFWPLTACLLYCGDVEITRA